MSAVEVTGLTKSFNGAAVLRQVDLSVEAGDLLAVLGASGSGKTTLLRLLCGFERAEAGTIRLAGHIVAAPGLHVAPERRRIGYVAQEGALFPHLSVAANVRFGLGRAERRARLRSDALLRLVGLGAAYADRLPHELSGGEQQRVALARALAPRPALVLLDEPFSALDAALRLETRQAVASAIAEAGATAILVTHDQAEALSMGREVAVLRHGALIQVADPQTLYQRPADPSLAGFVGESVLLPGLVDGGEVSCLLGQLRLAAPAPDGAAQVMLRPEQIRLLPPHAAGIEARVEQVSFFGPDATVRLRAADGGTMLSARVAGHLSPVPGKVVRLVVEGTVVAFPPEPPCDKHPG